ncbi:MAG: glycosyltransferase family 2 protein [Candidatus Falkowbacteria bacterium]
MYNNEKIIAVLPAYNAAKTLEKTIREIPDIFDEIILVDDASSDNTVALAQSLGLFVVCHSQNKGYGGNQKTCYTTALSHGAKVVVMIHPDYQYDPKLARYFAEYIVDGYFDVVLGNRIRSRRESLKGGMPAYKYFFNRLLTLFENIVSGQNLGEWHSGMRAYSREVLENINWRDNSDDFVFDSQMLFRVIAHNFRIGEVPVPVVYFKEASSINLKRSLKYGAQTVWCGFKYLFGSWR